MKENSRMGFVPCASWKSHDASSRLKL